MPFARTLLAVSMLCALAFGQDGWIKNKRPGKVESDVLNDRPKVAPKRGGELTYSLMTSFRSLDAYQDTSAVTSDLVHGLIQEALVGGDMETWQNTPALAERWDVEDNLELKDGKVVRGTVVESADAYDVRTLGGETVGSFKKAEVKDVRRGTSFTFHLRKGVKFHNGDDFTAKDVAFTYKLLSNPKNEMPSIQGYFNNVIECAVIDDFTVRMTYKEQYWMALTVCGGYLYVRPHKVWDPDGLIDKDPDKFFAKFKEHPNMMHPVGTGPYQYESFKKDFEVVLKRFDGWWGARALPAPLNAQNPDKIRCRIFKDVKAQLQALKNGEIDYIATPIPPADYDEFFGERGTSATFAGPIFVSPGYAYVGFNLRRELWKDRKVRLAMAYGSVDIDKYIKDVLKGRAERVVGDYYMHCDSYNPELKPIPYDPAKADELLAESGWWDSNGDGILDKEGKNFEFEMLVSDLPPTHPINQYLLQMQSNLKSRGIKMEIRKLEWGAFIQKVEKGDFDACRLGWGMASPPDTQDNFQLWHSSQISENGSNHVAYSNPELDDLLVKIRRELDPKKRHELEWRVQKILHQDQPYNWVSMPMEHRAYNKKWRGVRFFVPRPNHALNEWYLGD